MVKYTYGMNERYDIFIGRTQYFPYAHDGKTKWHLASSWILEDAKDAIKAHQCKIEKEESNVS